MLLSIIIPCFNAEKRIANILESIVNECTDHKLEVIIVDNGSVDKTKNIYEKSCNKSYNISYKYIFYNDELGPGAARQQGENCYWKIHFVR